MEDDWIDNESCSDENMSEAEDMRLASFSPVNNTFPMSIKSKTPFVTVSLLYFSKFNCFCF